jgi:predicted glycosyltransferase
MMGIATVCRTALLTNQQRARRGGVNVYIITGGRNITKFENPCYIIILLKRTQLTCEVGTIVSTIN